MFPSEFVELVVWSARSGNNREYLSCALMRSSKKVELVVSGDAVMALAVKRQMPGALSYLKLRFTEITSTEFALKFMIDMPGNVRDSWKAIRDFVQIIAGLDFRVYHPKVVEKLDFDAAFKGLFRDLNESAREVLVRNPLLLQKVIGERLAAVERRYTMAKDTNQIGEMLEMNGYIIRFRAFLKLAYDYLSA